jgi:hypothetical protein
LTRATPTVRRWSIGEVAFAAGSRRIGEIDLVGIGRAGPVVLHAAALDDRFAAVSVRDSIESWIDDVVGRPTDHDLLGCVVPGALLRYDLPYLIGVIAPREVTLLKDDELPANQR